MPTLTSPELGSLPYNWSRNSSSRVYHAPAADYLRSGLAKCGRDIGRPSHGFRIDRDALPPHRSLCRDCSARILKAEIEAGALETMVKGYAETAVFTGHDWQAMSGDNPEPLDSTYSVDDITETAWSQIREDCATFLREAGSLALRYCACFPERGMAEFGGDFHYTRNHHGTGFWDISMNPREEPFLRALTDLAHPYGDADLDSNGSGGIDYGMGA